MYVCIYVFISYTFCERDSTFYEYLTMWGSPSFKALFQKTGCEGKEEEWYLNLRRFQDLFPRQTHMLGWNLLLKSYHWLCCFSFFLPFLIHLLPWDPPTVNSNTHSSLPLLEYPIASSSIKMSILAKHGSHLAPEVYEIINSH